MLLQSPDNPSKLFLTLSLSCTPARAHYLYQSLASPHWLVHHSPFLQTVSQLVQQALLHKVRKEQPAPPILAPLGEALVVGWALLEMKHVEKNTVVILYTTKNIFRLSFFL